MNNEPPAATTRATMTGHRQIHEEVLLTLRRIIRAVDLHSHQLIQQHGLTGPQLVMLRKLAERDETPIGELAQSISLSHPTVTGILARLERRGLVRRARSPRDRRVYLLQITEEGRRRLEAAPPLLQERFIERFNELQDWEQTQILSTLQRVVAMMEARGIDASPFLVQGQLHDADGETESRTETGFVEPVDRERHAPSPEADASSAT